MRIVVSLQTIVFDGRRYYRRIGVMGLETSEVVQEHLNLLVTLSISCSGAYFASIHARREGLHKRLQLLSEILQLLNLAPQGQYVVHLEKGNKKIVGQIVE